MVGQNCLISFSANGRRIRFRLSDSDIARMDVDKDAIFEIVNEVLLLSNSENFMPETFQNTNVNWKKEGF